MVTLRRGGLLMKSFRYKKILAFGLFALLLGSIALIGSSYFSQSEMPVVKVSGDTIADFSDKRYLVGATDHVFIGKVTSFEGQIDAYLPISQFSIEIIDQIKGNLEKPQIVIGQYGGNDTDENGKEIFVMYKDDPLIKIDKTYVFIANVQDDGSLLIIPEYGNVEVKDIQDQDKLKNEFSEAYKNEKIPEIIQRKIDKGTK